MDTFLKEYVQNETARVLSCSVAIEDVNLLEVQLNEAASLLRCKSEHDFCATSYQLRKKEEFVGGWMSFVKKYKTDTDRMVHSLVQIILGKIFKCLHDIFKEIEVGRLTLVFALESQHELQMTENTTKVQQEQQQNINDTVATSQSIQPWPDNRRSRAGLKRKAPTTPTKLN